MEVTNVCLAHQHGVLDLLHVILVSLVFVQKKKTFSFFFVLDLVMFHFLLLLKHLVLIVTEWWRPISANTACARKQAVFVCSLSGKDSKRRVLDKFGRQLLWLTEGNQVNDPLKRKRAKKKKKEKTFRLLFKPDQNSTLHAPQKVTSQFFSWDEINVSLTSKLHVSNAQGHSGGDW